MFDDLRKSHCNFLNMARLQILVKKLEVSLIEQLLLNILAVKLNA